MRNINVFLFLFCFATVLVAAQEKEEIAIIQLLEKESATWRSGDVKAHADCWAIKPYSRILISTGDGNVIDVPPQVMIDPPADMAGNGGTSRNSNYKFHIEGNTAWVSHDEVSIATDGSESYTFEYRMLEKINGEWKLVGQSIHVLPHSEK